MPTTIPSCCGSRTGTAVTASWRPGRTARRPDRFATAEAGRACEELLADQSTPCTQRAGLGRWRDRPRWRDRGCRGRRAVPPASSDGRVRHRGRRPFVARTRARRTRVRLTVFGNRLLQDAILLRELTFEILDVSGLVRLPRAWRFRRRPSHRHRRRLLGPPASIDHFQFRFGVGHGLCDRFGFTGSGAGVAADDLERRAVSLHANRDGAAVFEPPEQDLVGERVADLGLNHPRERPRAEHRVVALARQPRARLRRQR